MDHIIKSLFSENKTPDYLYIVSETKSDIFDISQGWEFNDFGDKLRGWSCEKKKWLTRNIGNESRTYFGVWA